MAKKGNREMMMISGSKEEIERIKKFCEDEALYMGRFMVRAALRHIEEVERKRLEESLDRMGIKSR
jgi:hypothetical protein